MINIIYRVVFYILLLKLTMTLYQRRFNNVGGNKRLASLYQSVVIGALYCGLSVIIAKALSDYLVYLALIVAIVVTILFRKKLFPYKNRCQKCRNRLKIKQILFLDSEICQKCKI